jgi:proteasome accessory factor C
MLCGVPPYLPNDYISLFIDGDHVTVDYAEHFSRPARLSLQEALALRLAIARLHIPEEGDLYEASIDLLEALDTLVLGQDMAALEGRIEAPKFEAMDDRLSALDQAVAQRSPVDIVYYSASRDAIDERRVRPFGRGDKRGNHYLVAFCEKAGAQRSFRLDRISSISPALNAPRFEIPPQFDLDKTLSDIGPKLGDGAFPVRLRFDKEIARFAVEDHPELKVESGVNGDAVGELTVGSKQWAVSYALRYGELAEVLEPEAVRQELVHRLRAFLDSPAE